MAATASLGEKNLQAAGIPGFLSLTIISFDSCV
jgi:hypothetical protein